MNLGPSHSQHEPSVDDYSVQLDSLMFARSPAGCAAYILGSIFYAATLNSRGALNNSGFAFVSILVLTSTIRLFLAIRGQRNMALDLDYKTVKGIHRIAIITMGLIWTAWVALVQSRYGSLSPESFIGMIFIQDFRIYLAYIQQILKFQFTAKKKL